MTESTNDEQSNREAFEEALVAAIDACLNNPYMTPVGFTVDFQASGEHPYRIATTEELYPVVGEVRTELVSDPQPEENSGEAAAPTGG